MMKRKVLAVNIAEIAECFRKRAQTYCLFLSTTRVPKHSYSGSFVGALGIRWRQPSDRNAADSFDKVAPPHFCTRKSPGALYRPDGRLEMAADVCVGSKAALTAQKRDFHSTAE